MKKIVCCILLSCFLLVGCNANISENNNTEGLNETQAFIFPEADNEEGTLYFTCKNWDSDIYILETFMPLQNITIISLEPLDLEQVKITLPIQNDYAVVLGMNNEFIEPYIKLTDYLMGDDRTGENVAFPYYLYQCYRGTDWKKMRELHDIAEDAQQLMIEWDGDKDAPEYIQWEEKIEEYEKYRDLYIEDYCALTSEDLPTFYCYTFQIEFGRYATSYDEYGFAEDSKFTDELISESFQTIDIQIGDKTYTENIGEVRLHAEFYPEHLKKNSFFDYIEVTEWPTGPITQPWGDGLIRMSSMSFTAEEDLTLTGLDVYESNATPLAAYVTINDERGNLVAESQWDLSTPISIEKGQEVFVRPIVQDSNAIQLEYGTRCCPVLEYTVGDETYYYMQEQVLDRVLGEDNGFWIRYAIVFDGLAEEIQSYFDDYYYPVYQKWREELN